MSGPERSVKPALKGEPAWLGAGISAQEAETAFYLENVGSNKKSLPDDADVAIWPFGV